MAKLVSFTEDAARRIGRAVRIAESIDATQLGGTRNYVAPVQLGNVFAVRLTQVGGSAGNASTQCSFTYDVRDMRNDETLATDVPMTGNGQRIVNAEMTAGTWGLAFFDDTGALKLIWADERVAQQNCT